MLLTPNVSILKVIYPLTIFSPVIRALTISIIMKAPTPKKMIKPKTVAKRRGVTLKEINPALTSKKGQCPQSAHTPPDFHLRL